MTTYTKKAGFTLIELLVVVAIIGVLSSVIITTVSEAQTKARIASIKSSLRSAINQAELHYNDNNSYTGLCTNPEITTILDSLPTSTKGCYVHPSSSFLYNQEYGLAASYNGTHIVAGPGGVMELDAANITNDNVGWSTAMQLCNDVGKRLAHTSGLAALKDSFSGGVPGMTNSWTTTEASLANAYRNNVSADGAPVSDLKTLLRRARCGQ